MTLESLAGMSRMGRRSGETEGQCTHPLSTLYCLEASDQMDREIRSDPSHGNGSII